MTPSEEYTELLKARELELSRLERHHERLGTARLGLAAAFLVLGWFCTMRRTVAPEWLLAPGVAFLLLVLLHQRLRTSRALAGRAVSFYRAGMARLRGESVGGPTGSRFADPHHVYGDDLDLFGEGGLYQRLCAARTPMGESMLAAWLLAPADLSTIRERQSCVTELRRRLPLREELAILGDTERLALHPGTIRRWLEAPDELPGHWLRWAAPCLVVLAAAAGAVWAVSGLSFPFLVVLVIEAALGYALRERVQRAVAGIENAYEDLKLLSALLRRIESERFEAPSLRARVAMLSSGSLTASRTLAKLATLVNVVEARRNPFLAPLLLPLLYTVQSALAAERWRKQHGAVVGGWLGALGEVEALVSIASYSFEHPEHPFPEFLEGAAAFRASGLGHPLISSLTRVRNDVDLSGDTRVLLVSGSNMSGKSTLLRSVGMNTVLAMAGAPVCARRLELTPLQVGASIRVNDSIHEGSSRFYAEITRLRQLFEPLPLPLLFLLDELLQGTNSTDRRIGARGVLKALLARGAIGCISTHDLDLTAGIDLGIGTLRDVHFQDELRDGRLTFDFTLREGVVTKSNGIELMRAIGLEV